MHEQVLADFLKLTVAFDFAGCSSLTNHALSFLPELKLIRALTFDHCVHVDDAGLKHLMPLLAELEVLSLAGLGQVRNGPRARAPHLLIH